MHAHLTPEESRRRRAEEAVSALAGLVAEGVAISVQEDPPRGVYQGGPAAARRRITLDVPAAAYDAQFRANG